MALVFCFEGARLLAALYKRPEGAPLGAEGERTDSEHCLSGLLCCE
jgi:hypothetical protein